MTRAWLDDLNPEQRAAVEARERPVLVLAGAGSGKTRVITYKIAHLVLEEGYAPEQILALTFTNKAAGEMRERAVRMLGRDAERATVGTFHAVGLRILRRHAGLIGRRSGFVVYDQQDQEVVVRRVMKDLNIDVKAWRPADVLRVIERAKGRCVGPAELEAGLGGDVRSVARRVYPVYEERLADANAVDFGDLLWRVVRLFREQPEVRLAHQYQWRYVLVDEFQDTNVAQSELLQLLVERGDGPCGMMVVGDDDQSIYSWRGAHIENILAFPDRYADALTVRLERNYRSSANILEAAGHLIARNSRRHPKRLWTDREPGELLGLHRARTEVEEARHVIQGIRRLRGEVPLDEIAVFYRTNAQSRPFEELMRREGIPYRVVGGMRFYERAEVKDVLAYLKLIANPDDDVSFVRVVNNPARGIGKTTVGRLFDIARAEGTSASGALPAAVTRLNARAAKRLDAFGVLMDELRSLAERLPADRLVTRVLERTGYLEQYEGDESVEAQSRRENLRELLSAVDIFCEAHPGASLGDYLDDVSLVADPAGEVDVSETVTMMTAHGAKGLEFDVVFVTGLEEEIFPHANSIHRDEGGGVEEERRLFYVALTRARKRVHLSLARTRRRHGTTVSFPPSRFLNELPRELLDEGRRRPDFAPAVPVAAPPIVSGEVVVVHDVDACLDEEGLTLQQVIGRKARHPSFGVGVIVGGWEDRVQVEFPSAGRKTIKVNWLELL